MKIGIPYANAKAWIPALLLVAANVTYLFGPVVQAVAVGVVLLLMARHLQMEKSRNWGLVAYFVACLAIGVMAYGTDQAVVRAGKLILFLGASLITVKGATEGNRLPVIIALRSFLVLCGANLIYAVVTGRSVFRADYLIEFTIYSSYTIAILIYLARPMLTIWDRVFAYIFLVLCGSTMGVLVLILAELLGRKLKPVSIAALVVLTPIGLAGLNLLMKIRGKSFTWDFFATSDRAMLLQGFHEITLPTFSTLNWIFGLGVGTPLHHFITPDAGFNDYINRLGGGAVYSFCLHNEVLRILCDFGLVGLFLIGLRLFSVCPKPVILLMLVGMTTNSYLYSFSGALLASGLFSPREEGLKHA